MSDTVVSIFKAKEDSEPKKEVSDSEALLRETMEKNRLEKEKLAERRKRYNQNVLRETKKTK